MLFLQVMPRDGDDFELFSPTSAPPPYQSRPNTPGASSLTKAPVMFYSNPAVVNTEEEEATDGSTTINTEEESKSKMDQNMYVRLKGISKISFNSLKQNTESVCGRYLLRFLISYYPQKLRDILSHPPRIFC